MDRRACFKTLFACGAGVAGLPGRALAQSDWAPTKPMRLVVPAAPGSVPDATARPLAEQLSALMGQPLIVENRPGAGGIVGMEAVARSAPDGHTIGLATQSQMVFNPHLFAKLPYDPQDVQPVLRLATVAMVVAAHPSLPVSTLSDLIALAGREAQPLQYGVPPLGTPPHVLSLLLQNVARIKLDAIPFKGSAEAVAAAVAGDVRLVIEAPPVVAPQVKAGRLKALAVTGSVREPLLPDVPTAGEVLGQAMPGDTWFGLVVARGTPMEAVARLQRDTQAALQRAELKALYDRFGWRLIDSSSPEEFASAVRSDAVRWGQIIKASGLKLT